MPAAVAPLRLGIAGCGFVTRERHLPALARVPGVSVVAVADVDRAAADAVAARFGVPRVHTDSAALIRDRDVDAVAVCVPPLELAALAEAALAAGKHVLVEKPLAASLEDADRVVEAASRSRGLASVGLNFRRHRFVERARELVRSGAIGQPLCVRIVNSSPPPGSSAWVGRPELGGSLILDRGVHQFDLWRHLLDDEVTEVSGTAVARDAAVVAARLRGGALAEAVLVAGGSISHEVTIHGARGTLLLDLLRADGFRITGRGEAPGSLRARVGRGAQALADARGAARALRRGGDYLLTYESQWRAFAASIRAGVSPEPSLADGRAALAVAAAALEAAEAGCAVPVDRLPERVR